MTVKKLKRLQIYEKKRKQTISWLKNSNTFLGKRQADGRVVTDPQICEGRDQKALGGVVIKINMSLVDRTPDSPGRHR